MNEARLEQVFLSQSKSAGPGPGIYEVSSLDDGAKLTCTCPGYSGRSTCKHIKFVKEKMDANNGKYPLPIESKAKKSDLIKSLESAKSHREFILKFGKIEVL